MRVSSATAALTAHARSLSRLDSNGEYHYSDATIIKTVDLNPAAYLPKSQEGFGLVRIAQHQIKALPGKVRKAVQDAQLTVSAYIDGLKTKGEFRYTQAQKSLDVFKIEPFDGRDNRNHLVGYAIQGAGGPNADRRVDGRMLIVRLDGSVISDKKDGWVGHGE